MLGMKHLSWLTMCLVALALVALAFPSPMNAQTDQGEETPVAKVWNDEDLPDEGVYLGDTLHLPPSGVPQGRINSVELKVADELKVLRSFELRNSTIRKLYRLLARDKSWEKQVVYSASYLRFLLNSLYGLNEEDFELKVEATQGDFRKWDLVFHILPRD